MDDLVGILFMNSFAEFLRKERVNILSGVSERNLCGRLALYMDVARKDAELERYYVDTEYNRKQDGRIKTILNKRMRVVVINCDLILHSRGEIVDRDNLIAIEMKKSDTKNAAKEQDRIRLQAMTQSSYDNVWSYDGVTIPEHVCGYELGILIELDPRRSRYRLEEFRGGRLVNVYGGDF